CTENDGGNVIETKGTAKGEWIGNPSSQVKSYTDECSGEKMSEYNCAFGENTLVKKAGQDDTGAVDRDITDCKATDGYKCGDGVCIYDETILPDFSIDFVQIAISPVSKEAVVYVDVENNGGSAMSVHDYAIDLDEVFADGTMYPATKFGSDTTTIAAGKTRRLTLSFPVSDAWLSTFETWEDDEIMNVGINIDSSSDVKEQDESNNHYAKEMHESANDII
ncbi:MAG: CARDB domain-containing protein, partial [Nanoarchaeota archaeon]